MTRLNMFQMSAEPVILFPLLLFFFFLKPSLPSIPPLHTPCHSSADGRSDTWRMLGNQRDSWLPSRGELLHMLTHMYILQRTCVQAYGWIRTITCMDSAQNSPCFSAYSDIFIWVIKQLYLKRALSLYSTRIKVFCLVDRDKTFLNKRSNLLCAGVWPYSSHWGCGGRVYDYRFQYVSYKSFMLVRIHHSLFLKLKPKKWLGNKSVLSSLGWKWNHMIMLCSNEWFSQTEVTK